MDYKKIAIKILIIFSFSLMFSVITIQSPVYAKQPDYIADQPDYPTLIDETVNISDPQLSDITKLVLSMIRYMIGLSGGVIIAILCYGGFQYITAYMQGGEEAGTKAKSTIMHAIVGLIIILGSYLMVTMYQSALTSQNF